MLLAPKVVKSCQLHEKMSFHHTYTINFEFFEFSVIGDRWLIPVSGVGRNGFPDKFSTLNCLLLLEFLIFLQKVFCKFFANWLSKTLQWVFWHISSQKILKVSERPKFTRFWGSKIRIFWHFFLQKLGPGIKKSYCMILDIPYGKSLQKTVCKNIKNSRRSRISKFHRLWTRKMSFRPLCGQLVT